MSKSKTPDTAKLDRLVAETQQNRIQRGQGYREQALKLYPWVCGRCGREFTHANLRELTVHHRDHNHDNNPSDGSNWELLCVYCHDNEHQRQLEASGGGSGAGSRDEHGHATHKGLAGLADLMKDKRED